MGYILENQYMKYDGSIMADGFYAGRSKKYHDMFDLTPRQEFAQVFDDEETAERIANHLRKGDWKFQVKHI